VGESESVAPAVCESLMWLDGVETNGRGWVVGGWEGCDAPKQIALAGQRTHAPHVSNHLTRHRHSRAYGTILYDTVRYISKFALGYSME
jgi:hypothetical protein